MSIRWGRGACAAGAAALLALTAAAPAWSDDATKDETPPAVKEVGGRLVIDGETVEVVSDPGVPPHDSSLATKTDTPLLETPRSVSLMDRNALEDLQVVNLSQAHDYTPGLSPEDERGPGYARGFRLGFYDLRRDGLRTYSWSVREPVALDRVQYLRGPAAVLYGDGSAGGLVNLVLKKPLPVKRHEASLGAGERGFLRFTADATGPLAASRRIRYRVVGAYEDMDNGFENDESRVSVLPMLSFDLGRGTTLHVDGEYYDQRGRGYRHTVPVTAEGQRGDFSRLPWDLNVAGPDDGWRGWNVSGGLRLDTQLSPRMSLHVAGRYTTIDGDIDGQGLAGLAPDGRTATRFHYDEKSVWKEYQSDTFATFEAATGSVGHRLTAGFEGGLSTTDSEIGIGASPSLDIHAPVYAPHPPEPAAQPISNEIGRLGAYLQDQARLSTKLTFVPSLRWSWLRVEDHPAAPIPGQDTEETTFVFSPSAGLVFLPVPWLSVYGMYAEGFESPAPGQFLEGGRPLEPVQSRSLEGGAKAELLGRRLSLNAAVFRMRQTNVTELQPRGFYLQIGEGESKGIELEAVGSPTRGLSLRGGYAWTRTEITRDAAGFAGRELPNAPPHKANFWLQYRVGSGSLRRLTVGSGVVHVSDRFSSRDNTVRVPAYTRLDATASYAIEGPRLSLTLAALNLTDVRYVTSGTGRVYFAGPPRRLSLTLGALF
jgi:iron complex outermembrane recepter protein